MSEPDGDRDDVRDASGILNVELDQILETVADPIFIKDRQHRWIAGNRAFSELMGHPREQWLGRSDFDFFPRSEAETFWKKDEEVFQSGEVNINEEPLTDTSGVQHVLVTKKSVLTTPDGQTLLVGIIRDITELKRTQQALRKARDELEQRVAERTQQIEQASAQLQQALKMEAIGQLMGGIAHDFNNLLSVVVGNLELLDIKGLDKDQQEAVSDAFEATNRGALFVRRLLAFARQRPLASEPVDVCEVLSGLARWLTSSLGHGVTLSIEVPDEPAFVLVDRVELETALLNLAINARDAMHGSGQLLVRAETKPASSIGDVALQSEGTYVHIEVRDDGEGMSAETLAQVFEPLFTTKPVGRGSGLGLSMIHGFTQRAKGAIRLDSTLGQGTSAHLYLPLLDRELLAYAGSSTEESTVPRGHGESVLLVEDDPPLCRLMVQLLEGLGYEVRSTASAEAALEMLTEAASTRVLVSDVLLGATMDGFSLAERARAINPELAVLFVSGYVPEDSAGAIDAPLLVKPFGRAELARAVHRALDQARG